MADDEKNLQNWLGWTRAKAEKGKWYVKGEAAIKNIADRVDEPLSGAALAELEELRKLCLEKQGGDVKEKAKAAVEKALGEAEAHLGKGELAEAQKQIATAREKAAGSLMMDEYEEKFKGVYSNILRAAYGKDEVKELMSLASEAFAVGWVLDEQRRDALAKAVDGVLDDKSFTPPSELLKMIELIEEGINASHWLKE